jgi:fibronectin type 3 domain-containing protein
VASSSVVNGYNVYRGSQIGGPYQQINTGLQASLAYNDTSVVSGQTYHYVVTALDGNGVESAFSNEAVAIIP